MWDLPPAMAGLVAGIITWLFTTAGAGAVFLSRQFSQKTLDIMLGSAAGIMLAASIWSLLDPALEMGEKNWGAWRFVPVGAGFILGAAALRLMDYLMPHFHPQSTAPQTSPEPFRNVSSTPAESMPCL